MTEREWCHAGTKEEEYSRENSMYDIVDGKLLDSFTKQEYIAYECPICGSQLICSKKAWEYHWNTFPESKSYCNGEYQDHIYDKNEKLFKAYNSLGLHPPTLMWRKSYEG